MAAAIEYWSAGHGPQQRGALSVPRLVDGTSPGDGPLEGCRGGDAIAPLQPPILSVQSHVHACQSRASSRSARADVCEPSCASDVCEPMCVSRRVRAVVCEPSRARPSPGTVYNPPGPSSAPKVHATTALPYRPQTRQKSLLPAPFPPNPYSYKAARGWAAPPRGLRHRLIFFGLPNACCD